MKKTQCLSLLFLLMIFLMSGCSGELVRVRFKEAGEKVVKFQHNGELIEFWTDFDLEYTSGPEIYYEIDILNEGNQVAELVCNPLDVEGSLMERNVVVRGKTKQSYLGLMDCGTALPEGEITLNVKFWAKGESLSIFRADLVLKVVD